MQAWTCGVSEVQMRAMWFVRKADDVLRRDLAAAMLLNYGPPFRRRHQLIFHPYRASLLTWTRMLDRKAV